MAISGGLRRNSGTELKLYLGCTGSTQDHIPGKHPKDHTTRWVCTHGNGTPLRPYPAWDHTQLGPYPARDHNPREPQQQAVRILLECFRVK